MGKFEDQLLSDLMQNHGPALATAERPRTRNTRPLWIAAGAVALAGAVTVGLTFVDGGTPAAFAVSQNADGSITVSIKDIAAIDPANKELERLGVPIRAVPARPDCPTPGADSGGAAGGSGGGAGGGGGNGGGAGGGGGSAGGSGSAGGGAVGDSPPAAGASDVPRPSDKYEPKPEIQVSMQPGGGVTIARSALTPGSSIALAVFTSQDGTVSSMSFAKIESGPMPTCLPSGPPSGMQPEPTPSN
ncbi:hypothetical protein JOF56_004606 [Kibdelosporangium banguiense]|uniref:Uncharacterized protein n=1 Tax=Kibdelosporangium banguiense TaxID=1365924 RepID=A0ABS4TK39_9PSEU|nr:hypothetical protein [Kibdelosporangium banguiense]MBP2324221.1 hypothetical protein [Kibdelosporangium banguiense]